MLNNVKRSKIIAMTATPMVNNAFDFISLMNLVLPKRPNMENNGKLPINAGEISDWPIEKLKRYVQGYISYVPDIDIDINIEDIGLPLQELIIQQDAKAENGADYKTVIYPGYMVNSNDFRIPYQGDTYNKIFRDIDKFRDKVRQASNFVYPDGSVGNEGRLKYMNKTGANDDLKMWLKYDDDDKLNYLKTRSIKWSQLIKLINEHQHEPGKYYCFTNFVEASGALLLSEIFRANGLNEYNGTEVRFVGKKGEFNYCQQDDDESVSININIPRIRRFAIITSSVSIDRRRNILRLFNSRENMNGDYIEVILLTQVARLGINLYDTTAISILDPYWNEAIAYQSISRAIRVVGFKNLLEVERNNIREENENLRRQAIQRGMDPENQIYKDPNKAKVTVKIYRHVAIGPNMASSDRDLYIIAENKAIQIEKLMQKIKTLSIDCFTHIMRKKDAPSARVKHLSDQYICDDTSDQPIDPNGYNVMYGEENVKRAIKFVRDIFKFNSSCRITDIYDEYREFGRKKLSRGSAINIGLLDYLYSPKFILRAVSYIITHKLELSDRFGFVRYLHNNGDIIFLTDRYPLPGHIYTSLSSTYIDVLNGIPKYQISKYVKDIDEPIQLEKTNKIKELGNKLNAIKNIEYINLSNDDRRLISLYSKEIINLINELSANGKAKLFESMALAHNYCDNDLLSRFDRLIIATYKYSSVCIGYPDQLIEKVQAKLIKPGPGRPSINKSDIKVNLTYEELDDESNYDQNHKIILHGIYGTDKQDTDYSTNTNIARVRGNIRVLDNGHWQNPKNIEEEVYRTIMKHKLSKLLKNKGLLYGRNDSGDFRVVDNTNVKAGTKDKRKHGRGRVCKTWTIPNIIRFLAYFETPLHVGFNIGTLPDDSNIEKILNDANIDTSHLSVQQQRLAYRWYMYHSNLGRGRGMTKEALCKILQARMNDTKSIVHTLH